MAEWRKAQKKPVVVGFREVIGEREIIKTREGKLTAIRGRDFIVRGVEGEKYPITKRVFRRTYGVLGGRAMKPKCKKCGSKRVVKRIGTKRRRSDAKQRYVSAKFWVCLKCDHYWEVKNDRKRGEGMGRNLEFFAEISGGGLIYGKYYRSLEIFIPNAVVKKYGLEKGMKVKVNLEKKEEGEGGEDK